IGCNQILFLAGHLMSQATNYSLIYRGLKANFMPGFIDFNIFPLPSISHRFKDKKPETTLNKVVSSIKKELIMTFATATMHPYIANRKLSSAIDHYRTHDNLCSTIMDTLEACSNLSTTANLQPGNKDLRYP
ncbi:MAG: hypothetical protein ACOY9Y_09505, partial [Bacillota bacterium]